MIPWEAIYKAAWTILALVLITAGVCLFTPKIREYKEYQRTVDQLEENTRLDKEITKHLKMQQERFRTDPRFVEFIAHEMGMVKSNETIFTFIDDIPATDTLH